MTDTLDRPQVTGAGSEPDQEVIARATALVPLIREHAEKSSEERRVVPEVVDALERRVCSNSSCRVVSAGWRRTCAR